MKFSLKKAIYIITIILILTCAVLGLSILLDQAKASEEIEACQPYNLSVEDVTTDSAIIKWKTKDECMGFIKYGQDKGSLELLALAENNLTRTRDYTVKLTSLIPKTRYYYKIVSSQVEYGISGVALSIETK